MCLLRLVGTLFHHLDDLKMGPFLEHSAPDPSVILLFFAVSRAGERPSCCRPTLLSSLPSPSLGLKNQNAEWVLRRHESQGKCSWEINTAVL